MDEKGLNMDEESNMNMYLKEKTNIQLQACIYNSNHRNKYLLFEILSWESVLLDEIF